MKIFRNQSQSLRERVEVGGEELRHRYALHQEHGQCPACLRLCVQVWHQHSALPRPACD